MRPHHYVTLFLGVWAALTNAAHSQLTVSVQASGSASPCGVVGLPVVYTCRPNNLSGAPPTDDCLTVTITINNPFGSPVGPGNINVCADQSVINSSLGWKKLTDVLRICGHPTISLASGNPYIIAPGQTRLQVNIPQKTIKTLLKNNAANQKGFNLPVRALFDVTIMGDPDPCALDHDPNDFPVGEDTTVVGIRRSPGEADDARPEGLYSFPAATTSVGDSFVVWIPYAELPSVPFTVTALGLMGAAVGTSTGLDSLQLRKATSTGCVGAFLVGVGTINSTVDVALPAASPTPQELVFPVTPTLINPTSVPNGIVVVAVVMPSETAINGSQIYGDTTILLNHSSTRTAGTCTLSPGVNYALRMIIQGCP